jgi:murein L,D-transpeptidase YafK
MARAGKPVAFAAKLASVESMAPLQDEARVRMQRYFDAPPVNYLPASVLQLSSKQSHALVIDTTRSRLFVYANDLGRPRYVTDFYISLGKNGVEKTREGDQKTPIGVYTILSQKDKLPDFYGPGAYPLSYPNEWDQVNGRDGHGIWLHGVPSDVYSRPPRASDGCIVLANPDLESVGRHVQVGLTPVIIADEIEWSDAASVESERAALAAEFEQWRADWQSRDTGRYLAHYSSRFAAPGQDLAAWSEHKRKVNAAKQWIKVNVSRVAMFRYPRERDFVVVTFDQDYRSSGLSNVMRKRQYWVKEGVAWKIIYEGSG